MKKYINLSLIYAIVALCIGVFYREFTKFNNFNGLTVLAQAHGHVFLLGAFMFLILALFSLHINFEEQKTFKYFMPLYNSGLVLTIIMMMVRGIVQVLNLNLSKSLNASISSFAGIGHALLGTAIILLLLSLKNAKKLN